MKKIILFILPQIAGGLIAASVEQILLQYDLLKSSEMQIIYWILIATILTFSLVSSYLWSELKVLNKKIKALNQLIETAIIDADTLSDIKSHMINNKVGYLF